MRASTMARTGIRSSTVMRFCGIWLACPETNSPLPAAAAIQRIDATGLMDRPQYTDRFTGTEYRGGDEPMAYTYHELKEKTIQDLRDIAKGVENQEAVQGYSQLNKEHLLPALCKALG